MKIFNVVIIRCSKYDDNDGFVLQYGWGVVPSPTPIMILGLVNKVKERYLLGADVHIVTHVFDESVQIVRPKRIARLIKLFRARSVVMLVGVQTNQFVRASDIALAFRNKGIQAIVGGWHISGVVTQFPQNGDATNTRAFTELGLQKLLGNGVTLFAGEAEGRMAHVLSDVFNGMMPPIYNYACDPPDILHEPIPPLPKRSVGRYVSGSNYGAVDNSRGCPFNCDFCCIHPVQGRKVRPRGVDEFVVFLRANCRRVHELFLTADNSSRDPLWKERFEEMIALQQEGVRVRFLMQVDTKAHRIPGFVDLSVRAGCRRVFIGVETPRRQSLQAVGKSQNDPDDFQAMVAAWRSHGVEVQFAIMIGFDDDTPESVAEDVRHLIAIGPDIVYFFTKEPCPGANDHARLFRVGARMDSDLNRYDTFFRPVSDHPHMTEEEWIAANRNAWAMFYSVENRVRILRRIEPDRFWQTFWNLAWIVWAIDVTGHHPMISGFLRIRDRQSRRSTFPRMGRWAYWVYNLRAHIETVRLGIPFLIDLTEVWRLSHPQSNLRERLAVRLPRRPNVREVRAFLSSILRNWRERYRS